LSYTTFAYDNLEVPCSSVSKGAVVELKVDVINEGTRAAEEVAFLFVAYPDTQARRSIKELKGFRRVALEPGQAKQIGFSLPVASLRYWNVDRANWEVEAGRVRVLVGGSAQDLSLRDEFVVAE
jgi:beta-glucosidase